MFAIVVVPSSSYAETTGNVNFVLGLKMLDEDDWAPVEDQGELGALISWGKEGWPVHIAIDILGTSATEENLFFLADVEGSTFELDVGVRKVWGKNIVRPFLGGGIALITAEFEAFGISDDDNAVGGWIDGGVFWRLGERFNIGFEVRVSRAEVTIFGVDAEAGGEHFGLILGFGW
jgi:hypothetical protein